MDEQMRERRSKPAGVVKARHVVGRRKFHGSGRVHDEVAAQVRIRFEFTNEVFVRAGEHAPVEEFQVVAGSVFTILRELDGRATSRRAMQPSDGAEHGRADGELQPGEAGDYGLV